MSIPAFTELEAVNDMLLYVKQPPMNSLSTGNSFGQIALSLLRLKALEILSQGWHINTRYDVEFTPDDDGKIAVPEDVIGIDGVLTFDYQSPNVANVNGFLYNITDNTDIFEDTVKVDYYIWLDFDKLPFSLRRYISKAAAMEFQKKIQGSQVQNQLLAEDYIEAKATACREDANNRDTNIFTASPSVGDITNRRINPRRLY